jgi:hypothetical protein
VSVKVDYGSAKVDKGWSCKISVWQGLVMARKGCPRLVGVGEG